MVSLDMKRFMDTATVKRIAVRIPVSNSNMKMKLTIKAGNATVKRWSKKRVLEAWICFSSVLCVFCSVFLDLTAKCSSTKKSKKPVKTTKKIVS